MKETPAAKYVEDHCGRKPGSASGFPFGEEHRVFKVRGRIFAVLHAEGSPVKVTFKADPELTGLLRGQYPSVRPARPFDKRYWSTLTCDGTVPTEERWSISWTRPTTSSSMASRGPTGRP